MAEKEKGVNIQVVCRCRPLNATERAEGAKSCVRLSPEDKSVYLDAVIPGKTTSTKGFTFDMVFDPEGSQEEVYVHTVSPIVDEVLKGFNCTIFAYGQTGTGKTFTMEGSRLRDTDGQCDELAGVIPRAIQQIFAQLNTQQVDASVKVSMLEMYNEELIDLLSQEKKQLKIFDNGSQGVNVNPIEEIPVFTADDIYDVLDRAIQRRHVAETLMNAASSRSHCIFSITIHIKETTPDGEDLVKVGKLNLVDLAGSENIGRSGATSARAKEAGNINKSLLTLGRVINELVEHSSHIPYRESKLTRLLQDSLGGRTKTCLIATISPASSSLDETISTLDYAFRAKKIKNKPQVNQMMTKRAMIKEYTETISKLKLELNATREKNGIYLPPERFNHMEKTIQTQATEILELKETLDKEVSRLQTAQAELEDTKETLATTTTHLNETKSVLETKSTILQYQKEAGAKLLSTAETIRQSLESSVKDIGGLHGKIDRKKSVEEENAKFVSQFTMYLNGRASDVDSRVETLNAQQEALFSELQENISSFASSKSEQTSQILSSASALFSTVAASRAAFLASSSQQDADQKSVFVSLNQSVAGFATSSTDKSQKIVETSGDFAHKAKEICNKQENQITALVSQVNESLAQRNTQVQQFAQKQVELVTSLRSAAQKTTYSATAAFATQTSALQSFSAEQTTKLQQAQTQLMANIGQLVASFVSEQQAAIEAATTQFASQIAKDSETIVVSDAVTQEESDKCIVEVNAFAEKQSSICNEEADIVNNFLARCTATIEEGSEISSSWLASITGQSSEQQSSVNVFAADVNGIVSSTLATIETSAVERENVSKADTETSQAQYEALVSLVEAASACDKENVELFSTKTNAIAESSHTVTAEYGGVVHTIVSDTLGSFGKMRVDQPTGGTPVKREIPVPKLPGFLSDDQVISLKQGGASRDENHPPSQIPRLPLADLFNQA